jgi:hypothetical protein
MKLKSGKHKDLTPEGVKAHRDRLHKTAADQHQQPVQDPAPSAATPVPAKTPEERFLAGKHVLTCGVDFHSSNPLKPSGYQVWYAPASEELFVRYYDNSGGRPVPGPTYKYWTVTAAEAVEMFRAKSKGTAVWDLCRVRGSTAHKKSFAQV